LAHERGILHIMNMRERERERERMRQSECLYVCVCVCICVRAFVCGCVPFVLCVLINSNDHSNDFRCHVCIEFYGVYICMHIRECMYVCMYVSVCMYASMYVCM